MGGCQIKMTFPIGKMMTNHPELEAFPGAVTCCDLVLFLHLDVSHSNFEVGSNLGGSHPMVDQFISSSINEIHEFDKKSILQW